MVVYKALEATSLGDDAFYAHCRDVFGRSRFQPVGDLKAGQVIGQRGTEEYISRRLSHEALELCNFRLQAL